MDDCYNKAIDIYNEKGFKSAWAFWRMMGNYNALIVDHVECSAFIPPNLLCAMVDLRDGKLIYEKVTWIKLILDGKLIWIPSSPLKRFISKVDLKSANLIGDTNCPQRITVDNIRYDVTLLKGFSKIPRIQNFQLETVGNQYTEFDRIVTSIKNYFAIHENNPIYKFSSCYAGNMLIGICKSVFYTHCQENVVCGDIGVGGDYNDSTVYPLLRSIKNLSCDWTYDNLRIDEGGWIPALRLVED